MHIRWYKHGADHNPTRYIIPPPPQQTDVAFYCVLLNCIICLDYYICVFDYSLLLLPQLSRE